MATPHTSPPTINVLASIAMLVLASLARAESEPVLPVLTVNSVAACENGSGEPHAVVRVTDAFSLVLDDGREVVLAGLLFPKPPVSAAGALTPWAPTVAAQAALIALTASGRAGDEIEKSASDRYGRRAAQVYVSASEGNRLWLQQELVSNGHAMVSSRLSGAACAKPLLLAEGAARAQQRGLWSNSSYAERNAADPASLLRLRSGFALVTGTVVAVKQRGKRLYINFGDDWKTDFTTVVPKLVVDAVSNGEAQILALAGRRVRVRGWIERRYGPSIELAKISDLEILESVERAPVTRAQGRPDETSPGK